MKSNTKATLNKEKDLKAKEAPSTLSSKTLNGKINPKADNKDYKTNPETKTKLEFDRDLVLDTEEVVIEPENKKEAAISYLLNGDQKLVKEPVVQIEKKKVRYLEKIKEDGWRNYILQ